MPDVKFSCAGCGQDLVVDAVGVGDSVDCPTCGYPLVIPYPNMAKPPPLPPRARPTETADESRGGERNAENEIIEMPGSFREFVGQTRIKERMLLAITAATQARQTLGHVLLVGPPGAGRRTLAHVIAKNLGANLKATNGATIEKAGDVAGLLTNLEEGDVLLIDEVFRLRRGFEEYFCQALANFNLDIIVDQGPNARSVRLALPRFTLIGTAPSKQRVSSRLLGCFPIIECLEAYTSEELAGNACRFAKMLGLELEKHAISAVAESSDGTPQDVLRRLRHVRDFARVRAVGGAIAVETAITALKMLSPQESAAANGRQRDGIPSEVRREVWRRDGGQCSKCGSRMNLEFDHIIPVTKGGSNTSRNIELLCEACNRAKRDAIE